MCRDENSTVVCNSEKSNYNSIFWRDQLHVQKRQEQAASGSAFTKKQHLHTINLSKKQTTLTEQRESKTGCSGAV